MLQAGGTDPPALHHLTPLGSKIPLGGKTHLPEGSLVVFFFLDSPRETKSCRALLVVSGETWPALKSCWSGRNIVMLV